jgi:hypothetical protein
MLRGVAHAAQCPSVEAVTCNQQHVVLPAFCDTSPGSVDERFLRSHRTRPMLTPRRVEAAAIEPIASEDQPHPPPTASRKR